MSRWTDPEPIMVLIAAHKNERASYDAMAEAVARYFADGDDDAMRQTLDAYYTLRGGPG